MRICIDGRMVLSSGIGTVIQNFLLNFSDEFELIVVGNSKEITPYLRGKSNWIIVQSFAKIYSVKEQLDLFRLVPNCDVFWSPHYNIPLLPIRAKYRVVTINDVFHLASFDTLPFFQKIYVRLFFSQALRRSIEVLTISNFSKKEILRYAPKSFHKQIEVNYCGVDTTLFRKIDDHELLLSTKRKYNLPVKYILCVGNVKPHKNLKTFVKAFASLKGYIDDYHLVFVGKKQGFITSDPELFSEIEEDLFLKERVFFSGFVPSDELTHFYNLATLFVFPSLYEGFGLPPLEAMACGCPVLVSYAASIPEVCGDAARYFNPESYKDLAAQLKNILLSDDNDKFVQRGFAVVKKFSWQIFYKNQMAIFNRHSF